MPYPLSLIGHRKCSERNTRTRGKWSNNYSMLNLSDFPSFFFPLLLLPVHNIGNHQVSFSIFSSCFPNFHLLSFRVFSAESQRVTAEKKKQEKKHKNRGNGKTNASNGLETSIVFGFTIVYSPNLARTWLQVLF